MLRQLLNTFISQKEEASVAVGKELEELKKTEVNLDSAVEAGHIGVWELDLIKDTSIRNLIHDQIFGYKEKIAQWGVEIFFEHIIPEDRPFVRVAFDQAMKTDKLLFECRILWPDKSIHWIAATGKLVRDVAGKPQRMNSTVIDITERKKNEDLQEETRKALLNVMDDLSESRSAIELKNIRDEAILANIGEGLVVVDQEMRVTLFNPAAEKYTGWGSKEIMGRIWHEVIDLKDKNGKDIPFNKRPLFLAIHGNNTTTTTTYFYTRKDNTAFPIAHTVTPLKINGKIIGGVVVFRDITRELAIDKAKSEFVSLASHQLRTPLGIIKWYLEALGQEEYFKKAPAVIGSYFDEINRSNERVLSLVRELLSVSRIEQGRIKDKPKSVDLIALVTEIVKQIQIVADKKKITLHLTIQDPKIPLITIDILRLREVIENLIINALEYTEAADSVEVTLKKSGETLLVSVKDTGMGISEEDQKKLFTKFFRSEKAVSSNPEGSGLGLYIVKSYVEGWGGRISVETNEGKGSTFTISLPILSKKVILNQEEKL